MLVSAAGLLLRNGEPSSSGTQPPDHAAGNGYIVTDFGFRGVKVVIEPEQYDSIEKPVTVVRDSSASGKQCVEIRDGAGKPPEVHGRVTCSFTVSRKGSYRLWGRRWWKDGCGNSVTLIISGTQPVMMKKKQTEKHPAETPHIFGDDASYNPDLGLAWKWTEGPVYDFEKGNYTLTLANREDGVRIDQILLAEIMEDDADFPYIPSGIEKSRIPGQQE